jgi:hypothetical protein
MENKMAENRVPRKLSKDELRYQGYQTGVIVTSIICGGMFCFYLLFEVIMLIADGDISGRIIGFVIPTIFLFCMEYVPVNLLLHFREEIFAYKNSKIRNAFIINQKDGDYSYKYNAMTLVIVAVYLNDFGIPVKCEADTEQCDRDAFRIGEIVQVKEFKGKVTILGETSYECDDVELKEAVDNSIFVLPVEDDKTEPYDTVDVQIKQSTVEQHPVETEVKQQTESDISIDKYSMQQSSLMSYNSCLESDEKSNN